jgi:hypothetical protein
MLTDRITPDLRTTPAHAILVNENLAAAGRNLDAKSTLAVIPEELIPRSRLGGIDNGFGDAHACHVIAGSRIAITVEWLSMTCNGFACKVTA